MRATIKLTKDEKFIKEAVNFEVLNSLKMDESDIVTQYLTGNIKGVFIDVNCYYMPIRITGTGITTREYVANDFVGKFDIDRLKHTFMTDRFLEQCGRIPVLIEHPEYNDCVLLSYNEPQSLKHIIGNTIKAYKKDNEVWAIAKLFDLSLLSKIGTSIFSTSPAVTSSMPQREFDGLYEEVPLEINHIAFVKRGYWDKVSDCPFDVSNVTIKNEALESLSQNSLSILQNL